LEQLTRESRRGRERRARRDHILEAARRVVAERGVEATRMEDIARAAAYTRRTLYAYFRSRDEVLLTLHTLALATRWEAQKRAMASVATGLEKVLVWGRTFFTHSLERPLDLRLQLYWDFQGVDRASLAASVFDAFREVNEAVASGLREVFELGKRDGSLRPDLVVDMCISQFIYSLRAVLNRALSPAYSFAHFEAEAYVEHYLDLVARGFRNPGDNETAVVRDVQSGAERNGEDE
jgi:AcrR family transcriptional regulator